MFGECTPGGCVDTQKIHIVFVFDQLNNYVGKFVLYDNDLAYPEYPVRYEQWCSGIVLSRARVQQGIPHYPSAAVAQHLA